MNNIYISLTGGLGNQLYITATGIALSKIIQKNIIFDIGAYKKYKLHKLLIKNLLPFENYENNNLIFRGYPLLSKDRRPLMLIKEKYPSYDVNIIKILKNTNPFFDYYLKGYFQSLSYFSHIIPELRIEILKNLKEGNKEINNQKIKSILENTLTIHIRRKDKSTLINKSIYGSINKDGFKKIINSLINKNIYKYLLIVGDDDSFNNRLKDYIDLNIEVITSKFLCDNVSPLNDFFFMINSKGLIVNNSSFSLWAGYLSKSNFIYYPNLIFPLPKHDSIKDLKFEDLIMPYWENYENQYL